MPPGLRHLLLSLALALLAVAPAWAEVNGAMAWSYVDYQRTLKDSTRDLDASSFLQSYSLLYHTEHMINSGRAGYWDLALGYQWASLQSDVNDVDLSIDSGKFLHQGELLFAPGGLPLRLQIFSRDMTVATPSESDSGLLIDPGIYTDLASAGQTWQTGITFLGGIKNGSYLGIYREALSKLPKLLIDYRETYTRNLDSLNQQHWRERDLAFVSLNKKDNWFHYRVTQFQDFLDPESDYEERAYVLGTIDQSLKRQWINLTNWIQISADGSLTQRQTAVPGEPSEDIYQLNLFTKLLRRDWQAQGFTSVERTVLEGGQQEKRFDLPVFASGQIDPRNHWRMSLIESSEEEISPDLPLWNEHIFYTAYELESQLESGHLRKLGIEIDTKRDSLDNDGQAARFLAELRTNLQRELATDWLSGYELSWYNHSETGDTYIEQAVTLSADRRLDTRLRYGGRQVLSVGFGEYRTSSTSMLTPSLTRSLGSAYSSDRNLDGTAWSSTTAVYLELATSPRWQQRFEAGFEYLDRGEERLSLLRLGHNVKYLDQKLRFDVVTRLESGDDVSLPSFDSELGALPALVGNADIAFSSIGTFSYAPVRTWSTEIGAGLIWAQGDMGRAGVAQVKQVSTYDLYANNGLQRKLMRLVQDFSYEHYWGVDTEFKLDGTPWYAEMRLVATFYPYRFMNVGARAEYRYWGLSGASNLEYGIDVEIPFEKFGVHMAYEYGQANDEWIDGPGLKEQRWEVDIRKTF